MNNKLILLLLIFICIIYIVTNINKYLLFTQENQDKYAICFISREYNKILFDFAETCADVYDVYIVVDDNTPINYSSNKIKIIQIDEKECIDNNYIKSTYRFNQDVTGWDKAFYYFCKKVNYDHVWFIEDDVFIANVNVLSKIDKKYPKIDMLCQNNKIINDKFPKKNKILPKLIKEKLNLKLYQTMCCAMRISKNVLKLLSSIAIKHKQLFFHEMTVLSLVIHNNLSYEVIPELKSILYRKNWKIHTLKVNPNKLYHPIKNMNLHKKIRDYLNYKE